MSEDDSESLVKETTLQGFFTGDHEAGLLHPEMPRPSRRDLDEEEYENAREQWRSDEMRDARLYLNDLLPDGVGDGEYEFHIRVEARPVTGETDD